MGLIRAHRPVLFLSAVFSRHVEALDWGRAKLTEHCGPVALESESFDFAETQYYERTMGAGIRKLFLAFERLIDPAALKELKILANQWEDECRDQHSWPEARPLNLDPGYLTEAKLILASTKDRDHRIYLDRGIFAEETLYFHHGEWRPREWTYPNYRRADYHQFFTRCRDYLRNRYRSEGTSGPAIE